MVRKNVKEGDVTVIQPPPGYETEKKKDDGEYIRGIKKIASYSGVTRIMKCNNKCGKFDEIVNIYVYPNGIVDKEYNDPNNKVIDEFLGENTISKKSVKDKDLTMWGRNGDQSTARRKRASKPVRRILVPKRGNVKKHK